MKDKIFIKPMTLINYIIIFFKFIVYFITQKTLPSLMISSGFLLLYIYYMFTKNKDILTIESFKIRWIIDSLFFLIFFFFIYVGFLLFLRFYRWGHILNIIDIYNYIIIFIKANETLYIIVTINFCLLFIITILILFYKLRLFIKKNLMKIHFFIISKYPMIMFNDTPYDDFRDKISNLYYKFSLLFYNLYHFSEKNFIIYIQQQSYKQTSGSRVKLFLFKSRKYNAILILIFLILYDLICNNFILTKFYYFLPFVFLYNILLMLFDLITLMEKANEFLVACILYKKIIKKDNYLIYFENNVSFTLDDYEKSIEEIQYILNNKL